MYRALITIGCRRFLRLAWKTFFHERGSSARLSLKRAVTFLFLLPALGTLQCIHWLAFLLDELLFPAYRRVQVSAPVFILGIPRSGTTLLQRLLAKDEQFTGIKYWESLLAPAIVERKFWNVVGHIDRRLGGFGRRFLVRLDARIFRDIRPIHPTSLFLDEEDEFLFFPIFSTAFLMYLFPFPEELRHLAFFDEQSPEAEKRLIMGFYKRCVQRHLYAHGPDKRYLAKNVLSAAKLDALRETFPDARVICSVRNPRHCVPSALSLAAFIWRQFDNAGDDAEIVAEFSDILEHLYRHPMRVLPAWPERQQTVVRYESLRADMENTVVGLYAHLGIEMRPRFADVLAQEVAKARAYRSAHRYAPADFGLTDETIFSRFQDVFAHYYGDDDGKGASGMEIDGDGPRMETGPDGGGTETTLPRHYEEVHSRPDP